MGSHHKNFVRKILKTGVATLRDHRAVLQIIPIRPFEARGLEVQALASLVFGAVGQ